MSQITLRECTDFGSGAVSSYAGPVIKVGKLESSELRLEHPSVGRMHATIDFDPSGVVMVTDLGSVQGTYINDQRVNRAELHLRDILKFGEVAFEVEAIQLGEPSTAAEDPDDEEAERIRKKNLSERLAEVAKLAQARRAQAQRAGGRIQESSILGSLIGSAVLSIVAGDGKAKDLLDEVGALVDAFCVLSGEIRTRMPAATIAGELDGLVEMLVPTITVAKKRLGQLGEFVDESVTHGVEHEAKLVMKLKDEFKLSEETAMEIVRAHRELARGMLTSFLSKGKEGKASEGR